MIRWADPETGLVAPAKFIPLLEETGVILEVGRWAMEQAMSDYGTWLKDGLAPPRIAVNVSAIQLRQQDFAQTVRELIAPLLIIHGEVDSQIPVEHARQIYAHANPATTELWIIPGADHGQAHAIEGPRYEIRVRTFLERHLCGSAA